MDGNGSSSTANTNMLMLFTSIDEKLADEWSAFNVFQDIDKNDDLLKEIVKEFDGFDNRIKSKILVSLLYLSHDKIQTLKSDIVSLLDAALVDENNDDWVKITASIVAKRLPLENDLSSMMSKAKNDPFSDSLIELESGISLKSAPNSLSATTASLDVPVSFFPCEWAYLSRNLLPKNFQMSTLTENVHFKPKGSSGVNLTPYQNSSSDKKRLPDAPVNPNNQPAIKKAKPNDQPGSITAATGVGATAVAAAASGQEQQAADKKPTIQELIARSNMMSVEDKQRLLNFLDPTIPNPFPDQPDQTILVSETKEPESETTQKRVQLFVKLEFVPVRNYKLIKKIQKIIIKKKPAEGAPTAGVSAASSASSS